MIVKMLKQLACPRGVFNPGDEYENDKAACMALIEHGYAYDPREPGPVETTEAVAPKETAAKRTKKPKRGRPRRKKK